MPRTRRLLTIVPVVLGAVLLGAPAAGAQLVDAGGEEGEGGLAFVLMTVLVGAIWGALFFMDRIRRRREEREPR